MLFAPFPEAGSVHTEPLFKVTSPENAINLEVALVEEKFMVPEIMVFPLTLNGRAILSVEPELIDKSVHAKLIPVIVEDTVKPPSIYTISPASG